MQKRNPYIIRKCKINVSAGTNSGDKQRIKGKGINNSTNDHVGDMYIVFKVISPKRLTREQKDLVERLNETNLTDSTIEKFNKFVRNR